MAKPPQNNQTNLSISSQQWSGPLPPPVALEHFDRIIPHGAERILKMAEQEQAHRLSIQAAETHANRRDVVRGQYLGAVILKGGVWQATAALVGVPLLGMVSMIVRGHREKK